MTYVISTILILLLCVFCWTISRVCNINTELRTQIHKLRLQLHHFQEPRSIGVYAEVVESPACFNVIMRDYMTAYEIRAFLKSDDPEFARICAEELAELINQQY